MPKTKDIIIGVLLIAVVILLADKYCLINILDTNCKCQEETPSDTAAVVKEGGLLIDTTHAKNYTAEFWDSYSNAPHRSDWNFF